MHRFRDDPILSAGLAYWRGLPRQSGVPDRRDLDPLRMPKEILANIALLDLDEDGADARFRLAGQEFVDNFGAGLKDRKMSELSEGDDHDYLLGHLAALAAARGAIYSESVFRRDRGGRLRTRRLMMPLSAGEPGLIAMVFAVQTWPRGKLQGMAFCEAIEDCREVGNMPPRPVRLEDG